MSHDLDADLDELLPECRQRPVLDLLRQRQRPQEFAYIVGQGVKLEAKVEARICGAGIAFRLVNNGFLDLGWSRFLVLEMKGLCCWAGVSGEEGFVCRMERVWRLGSSGFWHTQE